MKRVVLIALAAILPIACSAAEEAQFRYKEHYLPARAAVADPNPGQPDVIEVFWYGCPHCYQFDPKVEHWRENKPEGVNFTRLPASLGRPIGVLHSRAYFTAEMLGVLDKVHPALFDAIHKHHRRLNDEGAIEAVFVEHGVAAEDFRGTFNSFAVESKVQQAEATIRALGIPAVPAMVVDNRFWTSARQAGGFDGMLKVATYLATQTPTTD